VPISNELFICDLLNHTDCGRMVGNPSLTGLRKGRS
jgi:hypothetical protein